MKMNMIKMYHAKFTEEIKRKDDKISLLGIMKMDGSGEEKDSGIISMLLTEEQCEYLESTDYLNNLYNIKGTFTIKKNKKGLPFMLFEIILIKSIDDIIKEKQIAREQVNKTNKLKTLKKKGWRAKVDDLIKRSIMIDPNIITTNSEEHRNPFVVDILKEAPHHIHQIAVEKIGDSYDLVVGHKGLLISRECNKKVRAYVISTTREEFLKKIKC